jgi:hypothetical protein
MALDLISWLRWALVLWHVVWLETPPLGQGGSRCCHMSRGSQWAMGLRYIKKGLATLGTQLGSRVLKARAHVPKAPNARAIMGQQDVQIGGIIIACKTCGQASTVWLNSAAPRD